MAASREILGYTQTVLVKPSQIILSHRRCLRPRPSQKPGHASWRNRLSFLCPEHDAEAQLALGFGKTLSGGIEKPMKGIRPANRHTFTGQEMFGQLQLCSRASPFSAFNFQVFNDVGLIIGAVGGIFPPEYLPALILVNKDKIILQIFSINANQHALGGRRGALFWDNPAHPFP